MYICLICSSIPCWSRILLHTQPENGHEAAIDIERSELYCSLCCDQVYDPDFDKALVHAPPMRNYFLSDRHNHDQCKKRTGENLCFLCDIDALVSAMFSGDQSPYCPAQFLYRRAKRGTIEKGNKVLRCLLASNQCRDGDCQCIPHRTFSGLLRSDVMCRTCGFTSTAYDPCVHISLNLDTVDLAAVDVAVKPLKPDEKMGLSTLSGCLNLFTREVRMGSDQKLHCQNCQEPRDTLKQLSIKRLPWVLSRFGNRLFAFEYENTDSSAEYDIFGLIAHSGMLESGHYVTYLCTNVMNFRAACKASHGEIHLCLPSVAHNVDGEVESRRWCRWNLQILFAPRENNRVADASTRMAWKRRFGLHIFRAPPVEVGTMLIRDTQGSLQQYTVA
ncbi:Major facilitator superfamily protein [Hibiscus syriacus]|uniref:Major facilitator superfamily protein n=1 Tax=Hibiscus syriacus TaxID=106335 RepID=A0A6A2WW73_HIBSY|nr:Major facilitator superfamily protein [Hibiscus syriacus]